MVQVSDNKQHARDEDNGSDFDVIRWMVIDGEKHLATLNLVVGNNVYGEKMVKYKKESVSYLGPI